MSIKVLELALIVFVAFGLGFWQLYDVNRELKKDREPDDAQKTASMSTSDLKTNAAESSADRGTDTEPDE